MIWQIKIAKCPLFIYIPDSKTQNLSKHSYNPFPFKPVTHCTIFVHTVQSSVVCTDVHRYMYEDLYSIKYGLILRSLLLTKLINCEAPVVPCGLSRETDTPDEDWSAALYLRRPGYGVQRPGEGVRLPPNAQHLGGAATRLAHL